MELVPEERGEKRAPLIDRTPHKGAGALQTEYQEGKWLEPQGQGASGGPPGSASKRFRLDTQGQSGHPHPHSSRTMPRPTAWRD